MRAQTSGYTLSSNPRLWRVDGSKLLLSAIAGVGALAILGLLLTIVWMSLGQVSRVKAPHTLSAITLHY
jgi:hypothetical protein